MGLAEQKLVMDMVAWAGNVSSSVMIIFVNKILMNTTGYGFKYGRVPVERIYHHGKDDSTSVHLEKSGRF